MTTVSFQPAGARAPFFQAPYCMTLEAARKIVGHAENFEIDPLTSYLKDVVGDDREKYEPTIRWMSLGLSLSRTVDFERIDWAILRMNKKLELTPPSTALLVTANECAANTSVGVAIAGSLALLLGSLWEPMTVGLITAGIATLLSFYRYSTWSQSGGEPAGYTLRKELQSLELRSRQTRQRIGDLLLRWTDYSASEREARFDDSSEELEELLGELRCKLDLLLRYRKEVLFSPQSSEERRSEEIAFWTSLYLRYHRHLVAQTRFLAQISTESSVPFRGVYPSL